MRRASCVVAVVVVHRTARVKHADAVVGSGAHCGLFLLHATPAGCEGGPRAFHRVLLGRRTARKLWLTKLWPTST